MVAETNRIRVWWWVFVRHDEIMLIGFGFMVSVVA